MPKQDPQDSIAAQKRADEKARKHQWYLEHREEQKQAQKLDRLANPERSRQYSLKYKEKRKSYAAAHREEIAARKRQYAQAHRETLATYKHQWYLEHREETRLTQKLKKLENPEQERERNHHYYLANREKRLAEQQAYNLAHREERAAQQRAYRLAHREELRLKKQASWLANHEENLQKHRDAYQKNRENHLANMREWSKANPELVRMIKRRYKRKHPEQGRIEASRRRARKLSLPDTFTIAERTFMLHYWHHACAVCGNQEGFFWQLADDHWDPISSPTCPGTIATNMIPLCDGQGGCNNSKHKRDPKVWLLSRYTPDQTRRILKAIKTYFAVAQARQERELCHSKLPQHVDT